MDPLLDPASLQSDPGVDFREERSIDDRDTFDYFASIAGLVAVGITNDEGSVLLMNSPHGWRLPYGPVANDDDWVEAGGGVGEELTGIEVTISAVERVARVTHCLGGEDGPESTTYDVVQRAEPVAGEPVDPSPAFGPWDDLELGWFEAVPEDAYWDHGDAVADIELFVE